MNPFDSRSVENDSRCPEHTLHEVCPLVAIPQLSFPCDDGHFHNPPLHPGPVWYYRFVLTADWWDIFFLRVADWLTLISVSAGIEFDVVYELT